MAARISTRTKWSVMARACGEAGENGPPGCCASTAVGPRPSTRAIRAAARDVAPARLHRFIDAHQAPSCSGARKTIGAPGLPVGGRERPGQDVYHPAIAAHTPPHPAFGSARSAPELQSSAGQHRRIDARASISRALFRRCPWAARWCGFAVAGPGPARRRTPGWSYFLPSALVTVRPRSLGPTAQVRHPMTPGRSLVGSIAASVAGCTTQGAWRGPWHLGPCSVAWFSCPYS